MKTLAQELARRSAIELQMKDLLDAAARPLEADPAGIVNLGRAMLYAELYDKNEMSKARYDGPMSDLIAVLEARIMQRKYAIVIHANPGIYGEDDQGVPWTTFEKISGTMPCAECGAEISGGYLRGGGYIFVSGKRGEWVEESYMCTSHVSAQIQED